MKETNERWITLWLYHFSCWNLCDAFSSKILMLVIIHFFFFLLMGNKKRKNEMKLFISPGWYRMLDRIFHLYQFWNWIICNHNDTWCTLMYTIISIKISTIRNQWLSSTCETFIGQNQRRKCTHFGITQLALPSEQYESVYSVFSLPLVKGIVQRYFVYHFV